MSVSGADPALAASRSRARVAASNPQRLGGTGIRGAASNRLGGPVQSPAFRCPAFRRPACWAVCKAVRVQCWGGVGASALTGLVVAGPRPQAVQAVAADLFKAVPRQVVDLPPACAHVCACVQGHARCVCAHECVHVCSCVCVHVCVCVYVCVAVLQDCPKTACSLQYDPATTSHERRPTTCKQPPSIAAPSHPPNPQPRLHSHVSSSDAGPRPAAVHTPELPLRPRLYQDMRRRDPQHAVEALPVEALAAGHKLEAPGPRVRLHLRGQRPVRRRRRGPHWGRVHVCLRHVRRQADRAPPGHVVEAENGCGALAPQKLGARAGAVAEREEGGGKREGGWGV
jgi:hypothetical protein